MPKAKLYCAKGCRSPLRQNTTKHISTILRNRHSGPQATLLHQDENLLSWFPYRDSPQPEDSASTQAVGERNQRENESNAAMQFSSLNAATALNMESVSSWSSASSTRSNAERSGSKGGCSATTPPELSERVDCKHRTRDTPLINGNCQEAEANSVAFRALNARLDALRSCNVPLSKKVAHDFSLRKDRADDAIPALPSTPCDKNLTVTCKRTASEGEHRMRRVCPQLAYQEVVAAAQLLGDSDDDIDVFAA